MLEERQSARKRNQIEHEGSGATVPSFNQRCRHSADLLALPLHTHALEQRTPPSPRQKVAARR